MLAKPFSRCAGAAAGAAKGAAPQNGRAHGASFAGQHRADSSGLRRFDVLQQAVRRAGAHKVLFGSDGPCWHPGLEREKIRLLELPAAEQALIMGGNFLRLIGQG